MKTNLFLISVLSLFFTQAQTLNDMENFNLQQDTFLNGSDFSGGFTTESLILPNSYDTIGGFASWSGFAISTETDNTTAGFMNQYASASGDGNNNSTTYGLFYSRGVLKLNNTTSDLGFDKMYVNNSTYAYLSMRDGDAFAKKFGGPTGNDPDFFLLTIKKYENGSLSTDSINFYLADYRFSDNNQDYIISEWTEIDLSVLGKADSLYFSLSSSDNGQFGMNTPNYFCFDDVSTTSTFTSISFINTLSEINVYPNPTKDKITVENTEINQGNILIINTLGQIVKAYNLNSSSTTLDVSDLPVGAYQLMIEGAKNKRALSSFLKQ